MVSSKVFLKEHQVDQVHFLGWEKIEMFLSGKNESSVLRKWATEISGHLAVNTKK